MAEYFHNCPHRTRRHHLRSRSRLVPLCKRKMWRTVDVHLKTLGRPVRTILFCTSSSKPRSPPSSLPFHLRPLSSSCFTSLFVPKTLAVFNSPILSSFGNPSLRDLFTVRTISSSSSAEAAAISIQPQRQQQSVEWSETTSCLEVEDGSYGGLEEDAELSIPVRAYFFSTSVDLRSLIERNKPNFIPPTSRMTNYVVLKFGSHSDPTGGGWISGSECVYMVVFQYGSIVLFNVREQEVDEYLKVVERHASGLLPEMRKDEYEVREKPSLNTWMLGGLDYIMLQFLNIDGIRTIGSVLGQSIALDYYGRQVDGMVAEFTDINRGMEKTGTFTMDRKKLFQLVGKANSNLADVILKLGLFERSDIAWKDAKYAQIWEYLRDEFELTQRFASLDFKLKFVEHNIRFLQEILQNRKSDFLEWLIIILISAEIAISLYDLVQRSL